MKNLRRDFNRFCLRNRDKGIPNLMLWVSLGTFAVYLISSIDPSGMLPYWLFFDRDLILRGQVKIEPLIQGGGGVHHGQQVHRSGAQGHIEHEIGDALVPVSEAEPVEIPA